MVPFHDTGAFLQTVIEVYARDVKVKDSVVNSSVKPPQRGTGRKKTSTYSRKVRNQLRHTIRNLPEAAVHLTITYPAAVSVDAKRLKSDWNSLRRFFLRQGVYGLWVLEFAEGGKPHWHVVLSQAVDTAKLTGLWLKRLSLKRDGRGYKGIKAIKTYNVPGLADYLAKFDQKKIPSGLEIGKWWDTFGIEKLRPNVVFRGAPDEMAEAKEEVFIRRPRYKEPRTESGGLPKRFTARDAANAVTSALLRLGLVPDDGGYSDCRSSAPGPAS